MKKLALILLFLSFISLSSIYVYSSLVQVTATMVVNTTIGAVNNIQYELNSFNNSLIAENITFSGTQSSLRYLTIPKNSNVTGAVLNITNSSGGINYPSNVTIDIGNDGDAEFNHIGILNTTNQTNDFASEINDYITNYDEFWKSENIVSDSYIICDGTTCPAEFPETNVYDGDWDTYIDSGVQPEDYYTVQLNYTRPNGITNASVIFKYASSGFAVGTFTLKCYNSTDWITIYTNALTHAAINETKYIPQECLLSKIQVTYTQTIGFVANQIFYESQIEWYRQCGSNDANGNCQIPINITATNGKIRLDAINITYDYNASYLFTRNDSYTWNQTTNVIPNNLYNRRYSVNPTTSLASNNISLAGYYLRNWTATECEIDNTAGVVASNYCTLAEQINRSNYWPQHYIWDNNISKEVAVNLSYIGWRPGDYFDFQLRYDGTLNYLADAKAIFISGDYAYVTSPNEDAFSIFNISNVSNIQRLDTAIGRGAPNYLWWAWDIYVKDDLAYVVSWIDSSITIWNVSNKKDITQIGFLVDTGATKLENPYAIYVSGDIAYVAASGSDSLTLFNISNPGSITQTGYNTTSLDYPSDIVVIGNIAYVTALTSDSLSTFNVSNASNPKYLDSISGADAPNYLNGPYHLQVVDGIAYVPAAIDDAFSIFNVSDPTNIVHLDSIGGVTTPVDGIHGEGSPLHLDWTSGVALKDGIAYLGSGGNDDAISSFDVSDPTNIIYIDSLNSSGSPYYLGGIEDLAISGNNIFAIAPDDASLSVFSIGAKNTRYRKDFLTAYNPDLSTATAGIFTNVTISYYYNSSITQNQRFEVSISGVWYDITPIPTADCITAPVYTLKTAAGRNFYVCLSTIQKFISYKIESSN